MYNYITIKGENMKNLKVFKIGAVVTILFLGTMLIVPSFPATFEKTDNKIKNYFDRVDTQGFPIDETGQNFVRRYEYSYIPEEYVSFADEQNDIGYNADVGKEPRRSSVVYVGEPVDEAPGRGRTGYLDPDNGDSADCYRFSACEGQIITASLSTSGDYDFEIITPDEDIVNSGYEVTESDIYYMRIFSNDGAVYGEYTFSLTLDGQNDAGTGNDAGDNINKATSIMPGSYTGYMDVNDQEDWYSFTTYSGQGIFVVVEPMEKSDYDIHLYNPSGDLVYSAQYYGDDELEYPADFSGTWKIKLDMFPGWNVSKWPDDYFLYGSGVYELELSLGDSAERPISSLPQPEIKPVAQTFIVNDDPTSNKDEYGYLAAVPAANYIDGGKRYVSPIVYQGVDFIPTWFTSVDQTTQYLLDDWNTYLNRHGLEAAEFILPSDPVQAAADIATEKWVSSKTAVVVVDGSNFEDNLKTVVDKDAKLSSSPDIKNIQPSDLKDIGGSYASPMFIGRQWGAIHLIAKGNDFEGDTGIITPRYEGVMEDWWPYPYDSDGEDVDTFYPVSLSGLWFPYVTDVSGLDELQVIRYAGDKYKIPIDSTDCSIEVTVTTDNPSNLIVYLIDPNGNVRRPMVPHYNGGDIKPIHQWNGGHWEDDQGEFRTWIIEPHTDFSVEIHNAMEGKWTAIVVPFLDKETGDASFNGEYHITAKIREYNPNRIDAALSAANGAVIASMNHAPLLYVTDDSVPSETSNALSQLGATDIIFVNINEVGSASPSGSVTEYTTMQKVIEVIKGDTNSENFITITSLGTGDGYFAPATMAAAYHVSPVLNIGEANEAYNTLDMITAWREYSGDYYHGARSVGHLPQMDHPFDLKEFIQGIINGEFPHPGFDLKLRWFSTVYNGIHDMISGYNLDKEGQEAFLFVAPRDTDIRDPICRAMTGNNSYVGHIPVETPAFSSDVICRDVLYPAIIFANPGKDVTTSQMMNYPDGYQWAANDGNSYPNYATRELKQVMSSRGRFFEGHVIWDNLLDRYNSGVSISYYSGHGTGGTGISAQYKNIEEQFPLAEPRHEELKDFDWWDSWRGYSYDNVQTRTCRWGGDTGYNSQEPTLYDIIHFKWADQLFENLHSELEFWSSCTTGEHWGPMVYLSHGSAVWFGCAGSSYGIQDDLHNMWIFNDVLVKGEGIGESQSKYTWIFNRDFTTLDPTTLYGRSTLFQLSEGGLTNVKVLFGDPTMTCYSPDWVEPIPVDI